MTERVVVVGGGGFGRETLDVVDALTEAGASIKLLGVIDDQLSDLDRGRLADRGVTYLGTERDWVSRSRRNERFVVAIGSPRTRRRVAARLEGQGYTPISLIHPLAVIGSQAKLGAGVVVASGVQVSTNVTLGDHVHLNPGCIIGHDSVLREFVSVNPGAVVSGNVVIEQGSLIGAGALVLQGLTVGAHAIVGAAACVTRDVPADATVVGVPARKMPGRE